MNTDKEFNTLLLLTAFSCMSCDGDIADEEISLIKEMASKDSSFRDLNIDEKLEELVAEINLKGKSFLKDYLTLLANTRFTEQQELQLLEIAVKIIRVDNEIKYSEIKFFKVIRSSLKIVTDEEILSKIDSIDEYYLAKDIKTDYFQLYEDYFENIEIPKFSLIP